MAGDQLQTGERHRDIAALTPGLPMKPFTAGLYAIAAMVLTLELVSAATGDGWPESWLTLSGKPYQLTGISHPTEWFHE